MLFALCAAGCTAAYADATSDAVLAAVVKQVKADRWPAALPYVAVDLNGRHYVCRIETGKVVKSSKSQQAGAFVGDWTEVVTVALNVSQNPATSGASWLMHRSGGVWRVVATNEGGGYSKDALRKAKVPPDVITRLKLDTSD